ncbi:uncharacterized protein DS421_18g604330 [Arachis hypogaea]|nr:uncharacterized protein DS421_18g604330 [Arachis hypogaea]
MIRIQTLEGKLLIIYLWFFCYKNDCGSWCFLHFWSFSLFCWDKPRVLQKFFVIISSWE